MTFDEGAWKDEELSEDCFGVIVGRQDEVESFSSKTVDPPNPNRKSNKKKPGNTTKHPVAKGGDGGDSKGSAGTSAGSSAEEQSGNPKKKQQKAVSFSPEGRPAESDISPPKDIVKKSRSLRSKVSDREQRSRRRQAMIEEEAQTIPGGGVGSASTSTAPIKRPRPHAPASHSSKKMRAGTNEEVIKVPMLTGTLYLYRGLRRRAEFIRKF